MTDWNPMGPLGDVILEDYLRGDEAEPRFPMTPPPLVRAAAGGSGDSPALRAYGA